MYVAYNKASMWMGLRDVRNSGHGFIGKDRAILSVVPSTGEVPTRKLEGVPTAV